MCDGRAHLMVTSVPNEGLKTDSGHLSPICIHIGSRVKKRLSECPLHPLTRRRHHRKAKLCVQFPRVPVRAQSHEACFRDITFEPLLNLSHDKFTKSFLTMFLEDADLRQNSDLACLR